MSKVPSKASPGSEDAEYLKSEEIGLVIAKGMATLYQEKPSNPVDYLGKWLLNVSQVQRAAVSQLEAEQAVKKHKEDHERHLAAKTKEEQAKAAEVHAHEQEIQRFNDGVALEHDLEDKLQNLTDHLKDETKSTAVYIGKLVTPTKPIKEGDNDKAHIDRDAEKIIRFCNADKDHQYIVDKTLSSDKGLTFDVFKDPEPSEAKEPVEPELDEEGNPIIVNQQEPKEVLPVSLCVKEVVREPRIHYFKVPRLGSYLAIRLEYESCLFDEALDAGVRDMLLVIEKRKHQQEEIANFEANIKELKEQAEADGEPFNPEVKEWPAIEVQEYKHRKVQFVVCLNTLGQDREFTEEQRLQALRTVQKYRDQWEETAKKNLASDINKKVAQIEQDRHYKEAHEQLDIAEMELKIEADNKPKEGEVQTEESRVFGLKKARFEILRRCFNDPEGMISHKKQLERDQARSNAELGRAQTPDENAPVVDSKYYPCHPEQFKKDVIGLPEFNVIKFPRVFQTLFYLLGYNREQICERDTNALNFKLAKQLIKEELFSKIGDYEPLGPRIGEFKEYQKIKFLKQNIAEITEEQVEEYCIVVAKILKWVSLALDIRCEDVVTRRDHIELLKQERLAAVEAEAARSAKYEATLAEAKTAFEEKVDAEMAKEAEEEEEPEEGEEPKPKRERPNFDLIEFKTEFDANNPTIEIPPEVVDDIDNDYDLPYSAPSLEKE